MQIVHLKRFDYVSSKWVKTQKVVNFPFKDFDPTAYLASVPQETILRHRQLLDKKKRSSLELESSAETVVEETSINEDDDDDERTSMGEKAKPATGADKQKTTTTEHGHSNSDTFDETSRLVDLDDTLKSSQRKRKKEPGKSRIRERLVSTSLQKTPIIDEDLHDFHEHKLLEGQDPFDLRYQLYAVVVSRKCYFYYVFEIRY